MWVRSGREYSLCSSVPLWLGQSIAVHHRGSETQRISDSSSPMPNSEEPKDLSYLLWRPIMVTVLCNDAEIEVADGELCQICGCELEEFDEVTGTGIHGYYHWICVNHVDA